jgi:uncharacterized membrane protein YqiK
MQAFFDLPFVMQLTACVVLLALLVWASGLTIVAEDQVGMVIKKFATDSLPAGRLLAMHGEAGYQADLLAPGWHLGYFPWQYTVKKAPWIEIPQGEIGLVLAVDGAPIPSTRILAKVVDCDHFQDARRFLSTGGEKGRQLMILTAGRYRIHPMLFQVITADNAKEHGMHPQQLQVFRMESDRVGIVTTLDGAPIDAGEIAGPIVDGHESFQNPRVFMDNGGRRGLQEQVLLSGTWNLNPWFAEVEVTGMTEVPVGHVGVVISFVGKVHQDVSGSTFKHGDLVENGHKGVWVSPLYPGKHPVNIQAMKVELVPTTNIVLNWADRTESHKYDERLSSITVRSKDGFSFNLDVSEIIHVAATEAPKVISRVGSMQNLVDNVLEPTIGNYFRNSAQNYTVLDFLAARAERQSMAAEQIRTAIHIYDVEAIDTLIGDITPPAALMQTQTDRKIAEEQKKTYEMQEAAQVQRQKLVRETSQAEIQDALVKSEQGVRIAELQAAQRVKAAYGDGESAKVLATGEAEAVKLRAEGDGQAQRLRGLGEAEAIRAVGAAKAEAYQAGTQSLGAGPYTLIQLMQAIAEGKVKVTPDMLVQGGEGHGTLMDTLLGLLSQSLARGHKDAGQA